ncbi:MAG TPA: dihydrofolate reductase family protein [bacterium]|nr:dihydrofolate reductase family protein [bacterium]
MGRTLRRNGSTAGKVLWHVTMSLDGFIAGPGDVMDRILRYSGPHEASAMRAITDEVVSTTGAVLVGRRSYDTGRRNGQRAEFSTVYGGAWTGPQFVLTHRAPDVPEDPTITFLSGDIHRAVTTALRAAKGKNVVVIGANVAQQCIHARLVDEILVRLAPVLLGEGVRLYGGPWTLPIDLETASITRSGQLTNLRFRVVRSPST